METLTGLKLKDWSVEIEGDEVDANEELISQKMILNPNEYKNQKESDEEINEVRELAGLETKKLYQEDEYIKNLKAIAGF